MLAPTSAKFRDNLNLEQVKVSQSHQSCCQSKRLWTSC